MKIWNWNIAVRRENRGREKLMGRNSSIQNITRLANTLGVMDVIVLNSCHKHVSGTHVHILRVVRA